MKNAIIATAPEHNMIMSYLDDTDRENGDLSDAIEAQLVIAYQKGYDQAILDKIPC